MRFLILFLFGFSLAFELNSQQIFESFSKNFNLTLKSQKDFLNGRENFFMKLWKLKDGRKSSVEISNNFGEGGDEPKTYWNSMKMSKSSIWRNKNLPSELSSLENSSTETENSSEDNLEKLYNKMLEKINENNLSDEFEDFQPENFGGLGIFGGQLAVRLKKLFLKFNKLKKIKFQKEGQFPHQAYLLTRDKKKRHFECGGSIISKSWVITAAVRNSQKISKI